jgi:hypothetical protein
MNILKLIRALTDIADSADDAKKVEVMIRERPIHVSKDIEIKTFHNENLAEKGIEILVVLDQ